MATGKQKQGSKREWFRKSNGNGINDEALKLANRARDESERLKSMAYESLKGATINSEPQVTQSGLVNQLQGCAHPKSVAIAAASTLEEALAARSDWEASHSHGQGKFSSTLQRLATSVASFMGAYSGIVNAVKAVGGPYGEAGYQAISILLIVAVNKSRNDEFIATELENLVDCFPRIDLLAQLYPDEKIERRVLEVHSGVIYFARDATTYFLNSYKRFYKSLKPAENAVRKQVDSIKRSLAELNAWSTTFMHLKTQELIEGKNQLIAMNHELKVKIEELQLKLNDMDTRDKQRRKQEGLDALETVRVALGRPDEKLNSNLEKCLRSHQMVFPSMGQSGKRSAKYLQMSLDLLKSEDSYRGWSESKIGCILILGGRTKAEGQLQPSGHSWLSLAATFMAEKLRENKNSLVAFFSCHPKSWLHPEEEQSVREIVAGLLFQVLSSEPSIIEDNFQRQLVNLNIENWVKKGDKSALVTIMSSVIALFQKASERGWIYLIVDRAERCTNGLNSLLGWFRELVMDPGCKIKVLIVFDTVGSDMSEEEWQYFLEESKGRVYSRTGWNQDKPGFIYK